MQCSVTIENKLDCAVDNEDSCLTFSIPDGVMTVDVYPFFFSTLLLPFTLNSHRITFKYFFLNFKNEIYSCNIRLPQVHFVI